MDEQPYIQMMIMQENTMLMKMSLQKIIKQGLDFPTYIAPLNALRQSCGVFDFGKGQVQVPASLATAWEEAGSIHSQVFGALLEMTSGWRLSPEDAMARIDPLPKEIEKILLATEAVIEKETGLKQTAQTEKRLNFLSDHTTKWFNENWGSNP